MRKYFFILLGFLIVFALSGSFSGCKTGYGCPVEEQYKESQSKPMSKKRGKSRLFKEK